MTAGLRQWLSALAAMFSTILALKSFGEPLHKVVFGHMGIGGIWHSSGTKD